MEKLKCPEIRFKGFDLNWEKNILRDITTFINGRAYSQEELLKKGKYPVLRVGNFNTNSHWYYSDLELGEKYYAEDGDLLYTWSTIFSPYIWKGEKVIYHYHIWKVELSKKLDKLFTFHFFKADEISLTNNTNGSTMIHVTKGEMEGKIIHIPVLTEQIQIGSFFQNFDQSIALHEKKLSQTQNLKKAMLEKMFSKAGSTQPEIRLKGFSGEWEQRKLGDILKIKSGMSQKEIEVEKGRYPILATGGEIGRTDTPLYTKESVLIGRKGTIDKPYYMNSPFWTVDTLFYSEINDSNFAYFIYVLFQKINWRNYNTSTGVPSLTSSTIHDIEVQIPGYHEQKTIAHFFRQLDETLALQQQQLQTLKKLKQAFLEKMFV